MSPSTARGERTRAEILDAGRAHLLEAGVERFSLREVARRARLAPSAVYNHFGSREDLVNTLAVEAVHRLGAYMERVPREGVPATARLHGLCDAYLAFAKENPEQYRLAFDMLTVPTRTWPEYVAVAYPFTLLVEAATAGIASGEVLDPDGVGAAGIAYGLWSLVHGTVMLSAHHLAAVVDDLAPLRDTAIRTHLAGLAANPR